MVERWRKLGGRMACAVIVVALASFPAGAQMSAQDVEETGSAAQLQAIERTVAGIDSRLDSYRLVQGSYESNGNQATYAAYTTADAVPVRVDENWTLSWGGRSQVTVHYRDGAPIRYIESAERQTDPRYPNLAVPIAARLYFDDGIFIAGESTAGDRSTGLTAEQINATDQYIRRLTTLATDYGQAHSVRVRYRCADGANLEAIYFNQEDVVSLSFDGAEPIYLRQQESGSGFRYGRPNQTFVGKGAEVTWKTELGGEVRCVETTAP